MSERTDKDRIDWLNALAPIPNGPRVFITGNGLWCVKDKSGPDMRFLIDQAMDAAESEDLDKAWKALREDLRGFLRPANSGVCFDANGVWYCMIGDGASTARGRETALLEAYRASLVTK